MCHEPFRKINYLSEGKIEVLCICSSHIEKSNGLPGIVMISFCQISCNWQTCIFIVKQKMYGNF